MTSAAHKYGEQTLGKAQGSFILGTSQHQKEQR